MSSKIAEGTVDFTGQYVMSEQENMFEWMKANGFGIIARNAIHAFGYGIGKAHLNISHEGNLFKWETVNPKKKFTNSVVIDGTEQTVINGQDEEDIMIPTWVDDGTKLRREGVGGKFAGGYSLTSLEEDGRLLIVAETNGVTMKRWFTRKTASKK
jgi:hypothetical protein